ncbi:MAG: multiubiquitin domain-containing protein [Solirubrobacteraceae bacterium]
MLSNDTQQGHEEQHEHRGHEHEHHEITIIVNAQKKKVTARELTFQEVVNLAYDNNPPTGENWSITVTYRHGPAENPHGSLVAGASVKIKEDMIFNVKATDRS